MATVLVDARASGADVSYKACRMPPTPESPSWDQVSLVDAVRAESVSPEVAALLVARDARPRLDVAAQLAVIDELAAPLDGLGRSTKDPLDQAAALAAHLHGTLGFHGNESAYYDARNSYLDEVLRRRTGIPITLCVVYAAVGRRAGVAVDGVGFPGHFLARVGGPDGVLVDPFRQGQSLEKPALRQLARRVLGNRPLRPEHTASISLRPLVVRMLLNLKRVHENHSDHARAMVVADRLVDLTDSLVFRRDRGIHALALGAHAQAASDLEAYLADAPADASDRGMVQAALKRASAISWS